MRKTWTLLSAIGTGLCLAAALGCGGKTHYNVPDVGSYSPHQGAVGSNVTITGADFDDIYDVSFGGQATLGFQVSNGGQTINVTVPATAATGPVVVQNPAGVGTTYTSFIVEPQILEVIIPGVGTIPQIPGGMSPLAGPVFSEITLTGYGLSDTSSVTIGGVSCTFTVNSINPANEVTVQVNSLVPAGSQPVVLTTTGYTYAADGTTVVPVVLTANAPGFTVTQ
jgi:hypothetical protein